MPYYVHFHRPTLEAQLKGDRGCTLASACIAENIDDACKIFDRKLDPRVVRVAGRRRPTLPGDLIVEVETIDGMPNPWVVMPLGIIKGRRMTDLASATTARRFLDEEGWRVKLAAMADVAQDAHRIPTLPDDGRAF